MDHTRSFLATNCRTDRRGVFTSVIILGIILGSVFLAYTAFSPSNGHERLRQVAIIFRHGDRTPTETYPKDPHINHDWEDGWGALTKKGMAQEYTLGQWIRSEYGTIISRKYDSSKTLVRSSYAERCIMSAQALLAGLFRPEISDYFVADMPWRPVPVHSMPRNLDKLIVVEAPCPRIKSLIEESYRNESAKSDYELADYYAELERHTGQRMKTITDVELLYNTLEIEEDMGLDLPEWTKKFYNSKMREITARSYVLFSSNTLLKRLRGGPLIKEILERMIDSSIGKDEKTLYLYSAHDVTLITLLRTMGFTKEMYKPDYGAAIIFELHAPDGNGDFEVRVKYLNNTETNESHTLKIPACPGRCAPLELTEAWKDVIPKDWDEECKLITNVDSENAFWREGGPRNYRDKYKSAARTTGRKTLDGKDRSVGESNSRLKNHRHSRTLPVYQIIGYNACQLPKNHRTSFRDVENFTNANETTEDDEYYALYNKYSDSGDESGERIFGNSSGDCCSYVEPIEALLSRYRTRESSGSRPTERNLENTIDETPEIRREISNRVPKANHSQPQLRVQNSLENTKVDNWIENACFGSVWYSRSELNADSGSRTKRQISRIPRLRNSPEQRTNIGVYRAKMESRPSSDCQ